MKWSGGQGMSTESIKNQHQHNSLFDFHCRNGSSDENPNFPSNRTIKIEFLFIQFIFFFFFFFLNIWRVHFIKLRKEHVPNYRTHVVGHIIKKEKILFYCIHLIELINMQ